MKYNNKIRIYGCIVGIIAGIYTIIQADVVSNWLDKNIAKPFERDVIKPTEKTFNQAGKDIQKAFVDFGAILEKKVGTPIIALGDTIVSKFTDCGNVVSLGAMMGVPT